MNVKIVALYVICATILITGCTEKDNAFAPTPTPTSAPVLIPTSTPVPTPAPTEIDLMLDNITKKNIADKDYYSVTGKPKDVHICGNMACEQAEWIRDNYEYEVGIVLLWNKRVGDNHAQTWVIIDDERYIIESTSNGYWTEIDHKTEFGDLYKITFVSISKGREHTKSSAEILREG